MPVRSTEGRLLRLLKSIKVETYDRFNSLSIYVRIGLIGVIVTYLGVSFNYALTLQWFGSGDSPLHLDYVWQVTQGSLPVFEDSVQYAPLNEIREHPVHYTSQHPPLFYVILAPFLAPFFEMDNWKYAMLAGRVVNISIGVLLGIAFAWAGWVFGGERRELFTVAVPFIGLTASFVVRNSADVLNDTLALLFTTIAIIMSYKIIQNGVTKSSLVILATVLTLGMSTRASYIATLAAVCLVVAMSVFIHSHKKSFAKKIMLTVKCGIIITAPILLSIGWFYWRNYQASGSWARSGAQDWISDIRPYKSLVDVISNPKLYTQPAKLYTHGFSVFGTPVWYVSFVLIVAGIIITIKDNFRRLIKGNVITITVVTALVIFAVLVYGMQINHSVGYGQFSPRYFISLMMPITVIITYALLYVKKFRGQPVTLFAILSISAVVVGTKAFFDEKVSPATYGHLGLFESFMVAAGQNGVPPALVVITMVSTVVGVVVSGISLYKLSGVRNKHPISNRIRT